MTTPNKPDICILQGSASEEEMAAITVACLQLNTRPKTGTSVSRQLVSNWKRIAAYESIRSEAFVNHAQTGSIWKN